ELIAEPAAHQWETQQTSGSNSIFWQQVDGHTMALAEHANTLILSDATSTLSAHLDGLNEIALADGCGKTENISGMLYLNPDHVPGNIQQYLFDLPLLVVMGQGEILGCLLTDK